MLLTPQYLFFAFAFFFFYLFEWKYLLFLHTIMNLLSIFTQLVGFQLQCLKNTHTHTHTHKHTSQLPKMLKIRLVHCNKLCNVITIP